MTIGRLRETGAARESADRHAATIRAVLGLSFVLFGSSPALAQWETLQGRFSVHLDGAYQSGSEELRQTLSSRAYGEDAQFQVVHEITDAGHLDAGGDVRLWRQLVVGASYSQLSKSDATVVTGTVPHPILFNADRTIDTHALALSHRERATHIYAAWRVQIGQGDRLDVSIFAGPSYFNVTQSLVTDVGVEEAGGPPFAAVQVTQISAAEHTRNVWGGHVGVDVTYMPATFVGVGGFVRFSGGSVDLPSSSGTASLTVGGLQAGGGLRLRF